VGLPASRGNEGQFAAMRKVTGVTGVSPLRFGSWPVRWADSVSAFRDLVVQVTRINLDHERPERSINDAGESENPYVPRVSVNFTNALGSI
jgi:hypothetical protein